jgi:hypothetical protein
MAKEPVLAPKVTTSWGIDHYAALEAGYVAPVAEEPIVPIGQEEEVAVEDTLEVVENPVAVEEVEEVE